MADQLIRGTIADGGIRVVCAITTDLTQEARARHDLSYVGTVALGRAMTAGLLLASNMKQRQARVNLRLKGDGPLRGLLVDAGRDGTVRGYVNCPRIEIPLTDQGNIDVGSAIGAKGFLHVIRDSRQGPPYSSTVNLVSGEVGEDVAQYLAQSEQTPSGISLGVFLKTEGVVAAGGLLVQVLPKAARDLALVAFLESRLESMQGFTSLIQNDTDGAAVLHRLFGDLDLEIFPDPQDLRFFCHCSQDRVRAALKLLGKAELRDIIESDQGAETTCDFCNEIYQASAADLEGLIQELDHEFA
ncbi:Hsp33 family molecular chaperone HslO [Lyngbya confervoides]|uniref:33 kDa chaperonin n=1 Tax=Lyngbya confervoides BDU141951 TaxID=1574623 RepID=A0ABD4SZP4_9CYAN|nr:Hsp33 family molecular chaperone HslO [Lyngbya confervoides]MCM1981764.1 Hsp33 family molecular chaperone HslO [Lyngbya confervoides BDU141951]